MDWLNEIWNQVANYVNIPYLLTFMLLAYLVGHYFKNILDKITRIKWKTVYTVLILATLIAVPYIICGAEWQKVLFSYALGTTLHELVFKHIEDLFNK